MKRRRTWDSMDSDIIGAVCALYAKNSISSNTERYEEFYE